jgi:protein O-mannosyl-transferase
MRRLVTEAKPAPTRAAAAVMAWPRLPVWLMGVLLVLGTTALYWPATRCEFINLDDPIHVTGNVQVQKGLTLQSIKWAFSSPLHTFWQPLTALSHMLDCQLYGLNPWGHHLTNVLLHALNAGLVFALLQAMTGATWRSLWVAALFTVHPLRVESVAWVTERKDMLSGCFGLLALIAYARYAQIAVISDQWSVISNQSSGPSAPGHGLRNRDYRLLITDHRLLLYLLSLFFLTLGLMSKPMLVTWPCVMLLLDYWPLRRMDFSSVPALRSTLFRLVREKIPFFVLAALGTGITMVVQHRGGALAEALAQGESLPFGARVGNALVSYCRYLGKIFWPADMVVLYLHPGQWPLGKLLLAGGLILGISVLVWVRRRRHPYWLMGWLWYCGTLVPVSQVIQTGVHAMADRYTYLPSVGVLILIVWGAGELTRRWRHQMLTLSMAGGAAIVLCLALTRLQIGYWMDSEALFRHALKVTENNYLAHRNLGMALYDKGQIDEAFSRFKEVVRLKPDSYDAHNNLGLAFYRKGQTDEAIRQFQEALRLDPYWADTHYNLGVAFYLQGRTEEAIRQFQETIRLREDHAEAHHNLGVILGLRGQTEEAIRQFQEALRLKPDYADARRNLDLLLATGAHAPPPPGAATNH